MPDIYRHLRRQSCIIRESGRVIGHASSLALQDVQFIVSAVCVARIGARRQREVVAHSRGTLAKSRPVPADAQRVGFGPYAAAAFTLDDGSPVE